MKNHGISHFLLLSQYLQEESVADLSNHRSYITRQRHYESPSPLNGRVSVRLTYLMTENKISSF